MTTRNGPALVYAHRGASAERPENTLEAFELALELGADALETDVHLTSDGVLVVSLEQAVAAPMASQRLAEAGARVIKVERPEGDFARGYDTAAGGISSYFAWLNRGKESVALDLKAPADMAVMRAMLARADVFIQNLAHGATTRMGLDA